MIDPDSLEELQALADSLGPFPLGALDASKGRRSADRNFHKATCPVCGPTNARLSKKTFETRLFLCGGLREAPHVPAVVVMGAGEGALLERGARKESGLRLSSGSSNSPTGRCPSEDASPSSRAYSLTAKSSEPTRSKERPSGGMH